MSLNILLVNDDSIEADGIETLFDGLVAAGYDVSVVAPASPQSAQGSTLGGLDAVMGTFTVEASSAFGPGSFAVDAATAPSVLTGLELAELGAVFPGEAIDVVVSGTNEGENIGESPNISGTVNGALAALFEGLPAIAVSARDDDNPELVFERSALFTVEVLETLENTRPEGAPLLPEGIGLSINVPDAAALDGVAMTVIDDEVTGQFPIVLAPDATEVTPEGDPGTPTEFFDIEGAEDPVFLSSTFTPNEESSGNAISEGAQFLLDRITVSAIDGSWFSSEAERATLETRLDGVLDAEDDSDRSLDILLINDDGFDSPGLVAQREVLLAAGHEVTVVAPLGDESFEGTALTIFGPWAAQEFAPGDFAVNATPNTTLSSGLEVLLPEVLGTDAPDLVVSGVGAGPSTGITANSSATIAPVVTSIFDNDIPAIAVSAGLPASPFADPTAVFENAAAIAAEVIDGLLETAAPDGTFLPADRGLNINVPLGATIEDVAFTKLDEATAETIAVERVPTPGNADTFRFAFEGPTLSDNPDSEGVNFLAGNVTITPLDGDYTAGLAPTLAVAERLGLEFGNPTVFDEDSTGIGSGLLGSPAAGDGDGAALGFETVAAFVGAGGEGAAEVVSFDDGRFYVTNGAEARIDVFDADAEGVVEAPAASIDLAALEGFAGVQSVAAEDGLVVAAIARAPVEETIFGQTFEVAQPGFLAIYDQATLELLSTIDVGVLPDAIKFTPDGETIVVAGEGEFNDESENDNDPLGTVGLVDVSDPSAPSARLVDFTRFNGLEEAARGAGIRLKPDTSFAQDVEPENIAIAPDGQTAFVSLQENNAIAVIDLAAAEVADIFSVGTADFSEGGLDTTNDDEIAIDPVEGVVGLRQPDALAAFEADGDLFVATADEGDDRGFDAATVAALAADGALDPDFEAELLEAGEIDDDPETTIGVEGLEVSTIDGDTDDDGDVDELFAFGGRSFSIFDAEGELVFTSGAAFEELIAEIAPERFNDEDADGAEDLSTEAGPEPEAVTTGVIDGRIFAFVGLEADGGIAIYDVTTPAEAFFVNYIPPVFPEEAGEGADGAVRLAPETLAFIAAEESATGSAQVAAAYEVSGTTVLFDLAAEGDTGDGSGGDLTPIPEIQGAAQVSPFAGETVRTGGVVTVVDENGFYLQDVEGDGDDATADGIFVFTGGAPAVSVGQRLEVVGEVSEFIPGGADTGNLSTTQIVSPEIEVVAEDAALPAPVVIGEAGRTPPRTTVVSDDELPVNLQEAPGDFDPEEDGIDFYESLEGMLVTIDDPVSISATNGFGETWVVADDGATTVPPLNERGALPLAADADGYGDLNPERIQVQIDDAISPEGLPAVNLGADLADVTGVVGYGFGNFEVIATEAYAVEAESPLEAEITDLEGGEDRMTVATYNVLNLAPGDAEQIAAIADQVVDNLAAPDVLALQEIQDDSGEVADGTLTAEETLEALAGAIEAAGGPAYAFESAVVEAPGATGGVPGGNIRNAFLWNPDRVEAEEIRTLDPEALAELTVTDPNAFDGTRDPLLGRFSFMGEDVTLVNNHFTSRFGSEPIFGGPQPFEQAGEAEREAEATTINEVVDALLAEDPDARVAVLGDLNTFEFTDELTEDLPGTGDEAALTNLIDAVEGDAYTFVFQGNAQVLDHLFVTDALAEGAGIDVVHVNTDFLDAASDHEPVVASFAIEGDGPVAMGPPVRIGANEADDVLAGGPGAQVLIGLGGDDTLSGGDDGDVLVGGPGDDLLDGGAGGDLLFPGEGADTLLFSDAFGEDLVIGFDPAEDSVALQGALASDVEVVSADDNTTIAVDGDALQGTIVLAGVSAFAEDQLLLA